MSQPGFIRRRVVDPLLALLKQGLSPERLSLCLAIGIVLGCFPVLGLTTVLCTVAALALRLNLPAIQLANWIAYPLQLAVLIPLFRLGDRLFNVANPVALTPGRLVEMFDADFWGSIVALWDTTVRAMVAWSLLALPALALLYFATLPLLRRLPLRNGAAP